MKKVLFAIVAIAIIVLTTWAIVLEDVIGAVCGTFALIAWGVDYIQFREIKELNDFVDLLTEDAMRNKKK